ncbi:MAG TPA: LOG family protein [Hyphomicrobiales bacterium]|nr:LOG family protein [Hyphomicrobiales bacterium]
MPDDDRQHRSSAYRLAALDQDYILGDSTRGVRFLLEYDKAEQFLRAWGVVSTVVVFGSARVAPGEDSGLSAPRPTKSRQEQPSSSRDSTWWYDQARQVGRIVSQRGGALRPVDGKRHNVIATGGGPGIMEAANRGAADVGAPSIGFNIGLPVEQEPNAFSTPELTFQFHYFAMRKMHLAMRAAALVVFPGGFGTFDELFEILTLRQTGKMPAIPIVCFDESYWSKVIDFQILAEDRMIEPADLDLFKYASSADEVWRVLVDNGLRLPQ